MFLDFLQEFAKLSPAEQNVFLFCLKNCPHPRKYTGDLAFIISGTGLARLTVYSALRKISGNPLLRKVVCYIQTDINDLIKIDYQTFCGESAVSFGKLGEGK